MERRLNDNGVEMGMSGDAIPVPEVEPEDPDAKVNSMFNTVRRMTRTDASDPNSSHNLHLTPTAQPYRGRHNVLVGQLCWFT